MASMWTGESGRRGGAALVDAHPSWRVLPSYERSGYVWPLRGSGSPP